MIRGSTRIVNRSHSLSISEQEGPTIFLIFLASLGIWGIGRLILQGGRMRILPGAAFIAILPGWVYCFLAKMVKIDSFTGFDPTATWTTIFYIIKNHRIPLRQKACPCSPAFLLPSVCLDFLEILEPFFSW